MTYITTCLSKIFKTDFDYILKNGFVTVFGQLLVMVTSFILSVAFAKLISAEEYGTYQYVLTIAEIIAILSLTGLSTVLVKSVATGYEGTLQHAFYIQIKWSLPAIFVGLAISTYYLVYENNVSISLAILLVSLLSPIITGLKFYIMFLQGKRLFLLSSTYTVIGNLLPSLVILFTLLYTDNVLLLIASYTISHTIINGVLFSLTTKYQVNKLIDVHIENQSKHLSFQDFILDAAGQIDKLMLFHFGSAATLAQYVFAINIPRQFQLIFKTVKTIVLPKVSSIPYAHLQQTLLKKILLLYIFVIPITIGYIVIAPYIFKIFFVQYQSGILYSQVYSLIFLCLPTRIIRDAFIGHDKKRELYKLSVFTSFSKVISSVILIPFLGIWGIIISTLVTQYLHAFLTLKYFVAKGIN